MNKMVFIGIILIIENHLHKQSQDISIGVDQDEIK